MQVNENSFYTNFLLHPSFIKRVLHSANLFATSVLLNPNMITPSEGEERWQEKQRLRAVEEQSGRLPLLGPDSEGPFTAVLLRLYKDPVPRSLIPRGTIQSHFRRNAVSRYEPSRGCGFGRFFCPITQEAICIRDIKAVHIVPAHLGPEIVDYLLGPGSGSRLHTADNCLLIDYHLEQHFDQGDFVLLPVDPTERPTTRWKVHITNENIAKHAPLGLHNTLEYLQGRELTLKNSARPSSRFLYYHFIVTLFRNIQRQVGNHEYESATLQAYAALGPRFRRSMLYASGHEAGINETARILIENATKTTFDDGQVKLSQIEEGEIARRMLLMKEYGEEYELEEEAEEDEYDF